LFHGPLAAIHRIRKTYSDQRISKLARPVVDGKPSGACQGGLTLLLENLLTGRQFDSILGLESGDKSRLRFPIERFTLSTYLAPAKSVKTPASA
jgi:hypothetical protein